MNTRWSYVFLCLTSFFYVGHTLAVTEDDVWVPKRYTIAKHKLLSTAVEAERTERCARVIEGRMSVEKSTAEAYYFIITCRDKKRTSYNLSYSYQVSGAMPILLNEQISKEPEVLEEVELPTVSSNEAWPLCLADVKKKTQLMIDVLMLEDNPKPSDVGEPEQEYIIPFEAKNPQGTRLRYQADCKVDVELNVTSKIGIRR